MNHFLNAKIKGQKLKLSYLILLGFLLVLIGWGAIPGYLKGSWRWQQQPQVTNLKQLIELKQTGLNLVGWQTIDRKSISIGGQKWLYQLVQQNPETQATLLLRPQQDPKDQPQVEWVDIKGYGRWKTEQYRRVQFTLPTTSGKDRSPKVEAQFFQGWNNKQTVAVLQWYAWPLGGNPTPGSWFWADRIAQWQGRRVPWVAVSITIAIEPLGDIETVWPLAQSLGQAVQTALMNSPLKSF